MVSLSVVGVQHLVLDLGWGVLRGFWVCTSADSMSSICCLSDNWQCICVGGFNLVPPIAGSSRSVLSFDVAVFLVTLFLFL